MNIFSSKETSDEGSDEASENDTNEEESNKDINIVEEEKDSSQKEVVEDSKSEEEKIENQSDDLTPRQKSLEYTGCQYDLDGNFLAYLSDQPSALQKHKWQSVEASSVLTTRAGNYQPANVIDGNLETAWSEGIKEYGEDEWIEIRSRVPYLISSITIYNGYQKSEEDYNENGRAEEVDITFGEADSIRYTFSEQDETEDGYSRVKLNLLTPVQAEYVTLRIREGGQSELYKNTFISEIVTE
eukprot:TRINITY_DN13790_c0_g1_i1.p1 TRINITY_DN13790_c0_g1~~TRINITY_DN13790_c0_g1_i1.p1  ORF type:complete len:257 (+),score=61.31 TRINITY_DN13790_c0_g1_i1:46-771(+)